MGERNPDEFAIARRIHRDMAIAPGLLGLVTIQRRLRKGDGRGTL